MSKQRDIQINPFQLSRLLNDEQKSGYVFLLNDGVYCSTCGDSCAKGVNVSEIHLNAMNDILIRGTCKVCNGKVTRIMEFGEDRDFCEKANNFREEMEN